MIVVSFLLYFGVSEKSTKTGEMTSYEYELQKGSISLSATTARPFHILSFRTSRITPTQSEATNYCCIPACFTCHNTAKPKKKPSALLWQPQWAGSSPNTFRPKGKKINVDDKASSSATVFCMFSSFRYLYNGERDDWQAHCILFSIAKFPKGSNCCEIFGGIKMWYVKRNNCRGR